MAKDARDTETLDFVGTPRKRGRKATGNAKTAAERQAAYRQRKTAQATAPTDLVEKLKHQIRGMEREVEYCQRERSAAFKAADRLKEENEMLRIELKTLKR